MITKLTALRTMTEFLVLGIVKKTTSVYGSITEPTLIQYQLDSKFDWFLSDEFKKLRANFGIEYHKQFINEKLGREDHDYPYSYKYPSLRVYSKYQEANVFNKENFQDDHLSSCPAVRCDYYHS
jgi:hypothetical protein